MVRGVLVALGVVGLVGCADWESATEGSGGEESASTQQNVSINGTRVDIGTIKKPFPVPLIFTGTVDFDTNTNGGAINPGTDLSTVYTSGTGVSFKGILCKSSCTAAPVYANRWSGTDNVVALTPSAFPGYDNATGAIEAWFGFAVIKVSIQVTAYLTPESLNQTPVARPWLEAYDTSGTYLGKTYGTATPNVEQTLTVSFSNIGHVRFGTERAFPWMWGVFDNLSYDYRLRAILQP